MMIRFSIQMGDYLVTTCIVSNSKPACQMKEIFANNKSSNNEFGKYLDVCLFGWDLWHINLCRLFNAKSIFIQMNSSISNNSV